MKIFLSLALGAASVTAFGAIFNINTGVANWQYNLPNSTTGSAVMASANGTWAPAPTGSAWVSFGPNEGISCIVGQTPGNGCASSNFSINGDVITYTLTFSAATLGATSGTFSAIFGADNRVQLNVGVNSLAQVNNGTAYNPLSCATAAGATSAGNTNPYSCPTVAFNASVLNPDGSLTITALDFNDFVRGGNPSGFVLAGTIRTGAQVVPEPATIGMVGLVGIVGLAAARFKRIAS